MPDKRPPHRPRNWLRMTVVAGCAGGLAAFAGPEKPRVEIDRFTEAGEEIVRIRNPFYEALFAPGQAMFPALYTYLPTGSEMLIRRDTLEQTFARGDGIQLCLPWVGDSLRRVRSKGLLHGAAWRIEAREDPEAPGFRAEIDIAYEDPSDGAPAALRTAVTVTARADTPTLEMETEILNTGDGPARFMWVAHGRMAPGGSYRSGDYVHLPADRCWVSDFRWPALSAQGVEPHQWTSWPIEGVPDFEPNRDPERARDHVYAFVPAPWMAFGNDPDGVVILMRGGPIRIGRAVQDKPYFCILRRAGDILPEMSLSRQLNAAYWDREGATVTLPAGESVSFSWSFAAAHGLSREKVHRILEVKPDGLLLADPGGPPRRHRFTP